MIDVPHADPAQTRRVLRLVRQAAALPDVRREVEANHDDNRWWPQAVTDPRMRMLAAGWSTRVSYRMVGTYSAVIAAADSAGYDALVAAPDAEVAALVRPLGLAQARIDYLRSLSELLLRWGKAGVNPLTDSDLDRLIADFAERVHGAAFKVAQCALLYARGYHCGIIPCDSGMVTKLAPTLGIALPSGPSAHEALRHVLERVVADNTSDLRTLSRGLGYHVAIPADAAPTWWTHLVLIYFKRLYLNRPPARLCARRPVCSKLLDCSHA